MARHVVLFALVMVWFCGAIAAEPAADVPPLKQLEVQAVYLPQERVYQDPQGRIWTWPLNRIYHESAWEHYLTQKRRFGETYICNFPLKGFYARQPGGRAPKAITPNGERFFMRSYSKDGIFYWTQNGVIHEKTLDAAGAYGQELKRFPTRWRGGNAILGEGETVRLLSNKDIWRFEKGQWTSVVLARPPDETDQRDFFPFVNKGTYFHGWNDLFANGEDIWLVRSTNANCSAPGSCLIHIANGASQYVYRVKKNFISGVIFHAGQTLVVEANRNKVSESSHHGPTFAYVPIGLKRIQFPEQKMLDVKTIKQKIVDLDHETWKIRDAASKYLQSIAMSQAHYLKTALENSSSPEQQDRLQQLLENLGKPEIKLLDTAFDGHKTVRLLFVDSAGRQYIQPWAKGEKLPKLIISDRKTFKTIDLPNAEFTIDHQGPDGTLYMRGEKILYALNPKTRALKPLLQLGDLGGNITVMAAKDENLCLKLKLECSKVSFWVNPTKRLASPGLPGNIIAAGGLKSSPERNAAYATPGPGNMFWFLKTREVKDSRHPSILRPQYQLWRVKGGEPQRLSDWTSMGQTPSIWPLDPDAAILFSSPTFNTAASSILFYDDGTVHKAAGLKELIESHAKRLAEVMRNGTVFTGGSHPTAWLVRMGDGFYMHDSICKHHGNGSYTLEREGIFRTNKSPKPDGAFVRGQWIRLKEEKPGSGAPFMGLINRVAGFDTVKGRILGFQDGYKSLGWVAIDSKASDEVLTPPQPECWARRWINEGDAPWVKNCWIMTYDDARFPTKAMATFKASLPARQQDWIWDHDPPHLSSHFRKFRSWKDGKWRTINASLYGGRILEDHSGCIWHMRAGQAGVIFPDGREQRIPLPTSNYDATRLAVESPSAVWVGMLGNLYRFALTRDEKGKPLKWIEDRNISLLPYGFQFAGPWFSGGDVYYIAQDKLHHTTLKELKRGRLREKIRR